jgi:NDMA-dependent alcohol dehydrogenase
MMKAKAAVMYQVGEPWRIEEVEVNDPGPGEVLVKLTASGLCHSDDHVKTGDMPSALPMIGGHEGAGEIIAVGPNVTHLEVGDHVVFGFIPSCGRCHWCSIGKTNLCDRGAEIISGDGTFNTFDAKGAGLNKMCGIGTFATHVCAKVESCIRIDKDIPLQQASLVGCGVTTGWGSAVYAGEVTPGDTVVVIGCGGIGSNAIQGARMAGATNIIAVDPVEFKREKAMEFGATHTVASMDDAFPLIQQLSRGVMADKAIYTVGVADGSHMAQVMSLISKGGRMVITAVGPMFNTDVTMNLFELTIYQKEVRGALFGGGSPRADIPKLLKMYQAGTLKLDELITQTYTLDQVNDGYADMHAGKNIRGMIVY